MQRNFTNKFCIIDDLFEINGNSLFQKHFKEAYPEEQELGLTNIDLEIKDKKISRKLYHKRGSFLFEIVHMPFINSNIPTIITYCRISMKAKVAHKKKMAGEPSH